MDDTNIAGAELTVFLLSLFGVGIPVGYMFTLKTAPVKPRLGAKKELRKKFLSLFLNLGVKPMFVHLDKDEVEIAAVLEVFTTALVRLCLWHALRAIGKKLDEKERSLTPGYKA